ncbi:MAG: DUF4391 domain-containing protein [Acetobacter sp.]|nr:DUF4391 domain-containing protein [Acetobacter sp.]
MADPVLTHPFFRALSLPSVCVVNKPIFKKMFRENSVLDAADKKALSQDVTRLSWAYTLKPETISIPAFTSDTLEYLEIVFLRIDLNTPNSVKRIARFINKAIPYPLILLFCCESHFALSVALKRINQADKNTNTLVVEEEWLTAWIHEETPTNTQALFLADCAVQHCSSRTLYTFYQDFVARIIALNAAARRGVYQRTDWETTENRRQIFRDIGEIEKQLAALRATLKQETHFNQKLALNMQIQEQVDHLKRLEEHL